MDKKEEIKQAEEYKILIPSKNYICKDHDFRYITGIEVKCTKCPLGFMMSPGATLKEGRIYLHGSQVV